MLISPLSQDRTKQSQAGGTHRSRLPWNQGLDLARTAAVFLVLYAHSQDLLKGSTGWTEHPLLAVLEQIFRPGWWGVRIFFALSGYLIGREVLAITTNGSIRDGWMFLARRWIRTVPTFWIVLAVTAVTGGTSWWSWEFMSNALFLNTAVLAKSENSIVPVGWSLVIEEWSYAALGLITLLLCLQQKQRSAQQACRFLGGIAVFAIAISISLRVSQAGYASFTFDQLKKTAILQLDSLAYGVLLACISAAAPTLWEQITRRAWLMRLAASIGMCLIGLWLRLEFQLDVADPTAWDFQVLGGLIYPLSGIVSCVFCLGLWTFEWTTPITKHLAKPARSLSKISYSVYLTHLPIKSLPLFRQTPETGSLFLWIAYVMTSICFGYLCWHITERPFMMLRRRLH